MVTLICGEQTLEATEQGAQSILYIQKEGGFGDWRLPDDSPYEFVDNALIKRANKKNCRGKKEPKGDPGGDKPSEQA